MQPHRVAFLSRFGLKTGIHFVHFGLESGMVFEGNTGVYEPIYYFRPGLKTGVENDSFWSEIGS